MALKLFGRCHRMALKLFGRCHRMALKLFGRCHRMALKLFGRCHRMALKLFGSFHAQGKLRALSQQKALGAEAPAETHHEPLDLSRPRIGSSRHFADLQAARREPLEEQPNLWEWALSLKGMVPLIPEPPSRARQQHPLQRRHERAQHKEL
eukprot:RCo027796